MANKSLTDILLSERQLSNYEVSGFVTDQELTTRTNEAVSAYYDLVLEARETYFQKTFPFTLAGGYAGNSTPVPEDLYKVQFLDRNPGSSSVERVPTLPSEAERNHAPRRVYDWNPNGLVVLPPESSAGPYLLTYTPRAPVLMAPVVVRAVAPTVVPGPPIYPNLANEWRTATVFNALHSSSVQDDSKDFVFQFTAQMIAFGWTVKGSSDATTAAMDGFNRIVTYSNWTRPAGTSGPFSWLCLQNGAGAQVIFAVNTDSGGGVNWTIRFAPGGGYTGGSTTSTPTAATDYAPTIASSATVSAPFNGGSTGIGGIHRMVARVQVTTDVKQTRIMCMFNGVLFCMMSWETASRPVSGWAHPSFMAWDTGGDNPASASTPIATENEWRSPFKLFPALTSFATTLMPLFTQIEGTNLAANESSVEVFTGVNALSGKYEIPPAPPALVNYDSYATSGQTGRHGSMSDVYVVPYGLALGSSWPPGSSDNSFNVFGNLIMPGDGNPVVTS